MKIPKLSDAERATVLGDPTPVCDGALFAGGLSDAAQMLKGECARYGEEPLMLEERSPGVFDFWLVSKPGPNMDGCRC